MKKVLFPVLIIAGLQVACNKSSQIKSSGVDNSVVSSEKDTVVNAESIEGEEHDETPTEVKLNNGGRWVANTETTQGINKMIALLDNFPANAKLEDYSLLKQQLEMEFNLILQRCTMTGEAHTQLHNYLMSIRTMIQNLESDNIEASGTRMKLLRQHLNEYQKYFAS